MIRAIKIEKGDLQNRQNRDSIKVTLDEEGALRALRWPYRDDLNQLAKRNGGSWNGGERCWFFDTPDEAQKVLNTIIKRYPDWVVIGHPDIQSNVSPMLVGIRFSRIPLGNGFDACLIPLPMPPAVLVPDFDPRHMFQVTVGKAGASADEIGLLIGKVDDIGRVIASLQREGAICDDGECLNSPFTAAFKKVRVKVRHWAVEIQCDLTCPLHYLIAPEQKYRWTKPYPNGERIGIPWDGGISTTRGKWPDWKAKIEAAGLEWEGDDPDQAPIAPTEFDPSRVFGWNSPAPNGLSLRAYQKEGAQFCASRGMRALIGDEMGVGKTAQAIAAVEGVNSPKVIIFCPANARYVWEQEVKTWGARGDIQHVSSQLDQLDRDTRWHIVTYDLIAVRAEHWKLRDDSEFEAFIAAFPDLQIAKPDHYPHKIPIEQRLNKTPSFSDPKRVSLWSKMMRRLDSELLSQFIKICQNSDKNQPLVILDEAHRLKNKDAKRTKAIAEIASLDVHLLMLTGTPLRNNEHEAAVLLGLLNSEARTALSKEKGYTINDIKEYLNYLMIRRTKAEILPDLPEKTRQRIDVGNLDPDSMSNYHEAISWARESYQKAIARGLSEAEARRDMQGAIEQARTALGVAKVLGGDVADLVREVVDNKGSCVVFCAHHKVSDELKIQLERENIKVKIIDGRVLPAQRSAIVTEFQEGKVDVIIGGINAAGEAITLTRADTVIFVELDWVPAALLQAEDRIHRVGQPNHCHVIQLIARMPTGTNLDEMMIELLGSKMERIGAVLGEETGNIISDGIKNELKNRLLNATNLADQVIKVDQDKGEAIEVVEEIIEQPKRKRGRPKSYIDAPPPTATERSRQSIEALAAAGGKRLMLRLAPDALEALRVIMALTDAKQETAAINQAIIARKNDLMSASTSKKVRLPGEGSG